MTSCQRKLPNGYYCCGRFTQRLTIPDVGPVDLCPRHYVEAQLLLAPPKAPPPQDDRPRVEPAPPPPRRPRKDPKVIRRWAEDNDRLLRTLALRPQGWIAKDLATALWEPLPRVTGLLKAGCVFGVVRKEQDGSRYTPAVYFCVDETPK